MVAYTIVHLQREKEEEERQRQLRNLQRIKEKEAAETSQAEAIARKEAQQRAEEERKRALLKDIRGGTEKKTSLLQPTATRPNTATSRRMTGTSSEGSSSASRRSKQTGQKPFLTREERNRLKDDLEFGLVRPSKEAQRRLEKETTDIDLASRVAALSRQLGASSSKDSVRAKTIPGADHRIPIPPKSKGSAARQIASPASDARALGGTKRDKRSVLEIQRELEEQDARSRRDPRSGGLFDKAGSSRATASDSGRRVDRTRDELPRKSAAIPSSAGRARRREPSPPSRKRRQRPSSDSELDSDDLDSPAPPSRKRRDEARRSAPKIKGPPGMEDIDIFAMIAGRSRD